MKRFCFALVPVMFVVPSLANADSLIVTDPTLEYYNVGPNNLDFLTGELIRAGASMVTPNGGEGTTGVATTTNAATGQIVSVPEVYEPSESDPNFFDGLLVTCGASCSPTANNNPANLTNPWTITFSNPSTSPLTTVSNTLSLSGEELPFVSSITLSGTTAAPTFSWTPPAGVVVNAYSVEFFQNNLDTLGSGGDNTGAVGGIIILPTTEPSITLTAATLAEYGLDLAPNTQYTIQIGVLQTRDGTSNISYGNIQAASVVYSNFVIPSAGVIPTTQLPTTTLKGPQVTYGFGFTVAPGVTYFLDPEVAIGYIYQTGAGNPNFASVELPDIGNPNPYDLYLWNGSSFVFDTTIGADTVFDFASGGVSEFEILGIDPALGIDPSDATAFVTGLTFESGGNFTGTMTPVVADVPEPPTLVLLGASLVSLLLFSSPIRRSFGAARDIVRHASRIGFSGGLMMSRLTFGLVAGLFFSALAFHGNAQAADKLSSTPAACANLLAKMPAEFQAPDTRHFCGSYPNKGEHFVIAITTGGHPKADYVADTFVAPPGEVTEANGTYKWKAWFNGRNFFYVLTPAGLTETIAYGGQTTVYQSGPPQNMP